MPSEKKNGSKAVLGMKKAVSLPIPLFVFGVFLPFVLEDLGFYPPPHALGNGVLGNRGLPHGDD